MISKSLVMSLLTTWIIGQPPIVNAQDTVNTAAPGDMIRIRLRPAGERYAGRVALISGDSLWMESDVHRLRSVFARTDVGMIERRLGGPSGAGRGLLVGGGVGVAVGLLPLVLGCESCDFDVTKLALFSAGVLGAGGALLGAGIGAIAFPASWERAAWPQAPSSPPAPGIWFRITLHF